MGYFVGRNTPGTVVADAAVPPSNPIIVENPSKSSSVMPPDNPPVRDTPPAGGNLDRNNPTRDKPTRDNPTRDNPTRENAADLKQSSPPTQRPVEKPTPVASREKPVDQVSKPSVGQPQSGLTFLQVVATSRPDSELIAETLAKKGFHTSIAPGPNAALFRVLVGPLNGQADAAETRVRLEAAGFRNPYVRKY